jgi:hypothetical protein
LLSTPALQASGRTRLQRDRKADGFDTWLDNQRLAGGATWTAEIEHAIDTSQVVLVVLALVTPGCYASEICRSEQLLTSQGETGYSPARSVYTFECTANSTAANKAVVGCVIDQRSSF